MARPSKSKPGLPALPIICCTAGTENNIINHEAIQGLKMIDRIDNRDYVKEIQWMRQVNQLLKFYLINMRGSIRGAKPHL